MVRLGNLDSPGALHHRTLRLAPIMNTPAMVMLLVALATRQAPANPVFAELKPDQEWRKLGRSLWFDPAAKKLVMKAKVVLREGPLEHLVCSKGTKEHEAILATDAIPSQIHAGLLLTGLKPGRPVQFAPRFLPPRGDKVAITVRWRIDGKDHSSDAKDWVMEEVKKTPLAVDWVFAGSQLYRDETTKKMRYAADDGDLITVANFASAILDLPLASSASDAERNYAANPKTVPPVGTEVFVVFAPRTLAPTPKADSGTKTPP